MKSGRRRAREFVLQGLYQWILAGHDADAIAADLGSAAGFAKIDTDYFSTLLRGVIANIEPLQTAIAPYLDRPVKELSPIERAILLLGTFELVHQPDVPYRVVINEAVELAKSYGGTDGHKYVNGVLDKVAGEVRAVEIRARSG